MDKNSKKQKRQVFVDGMMTFDVLENGLRTTDFQATEDVHMEAFTATLQGAGHARRQPLHDRAAQAHSQQGDFPRGQQLVFAGAEPPLLLRALARREAAAGAARASGQSGKGNSAQGGSWV